MRNLVRLGLSGLLAGTLFSAAAASAASSYPDKPVRLVLGFAAGGSNDVVARIVAAKASQLLGAPMVVENRPGANGAIASDLVAHAAPDGYTLLLGSASTLAINPHTVAEIRYDPLRDFEGIGTVAMTPEVIAINPAVSAHTLDEFIRLAGKQNLTMASSGTGGLPHLAIELFKTAAHVNVTHVPYKGGAPAATDVVAGHVDGIIMDLPPLRSFIESGRMRGLAVAGKQRSPALPDLPTTAELGLPQVAASNWFAVVAPKGTPAAIADKLHAAFTKAAHDPDTVRQLAEAGIEPMTNSTRADFRQFLQDELQRWKTVATQAGVAVHK
ncbi:Bug family tripartite tricarboxylate transporter substrate binding protein [Bordetella petrii]|uniref:Bug family tripartite tricarboxylate transporter substrate binding protein n=1 Tax=Bordetella petrii TaxID=94624 RepID=UPI001A95E224|nr:tripartite tricarboxylate transporter substrate binding protein [Bordetella petrii]MBO1111952.1 tripartite tricarboxylate transporter substrate binding protein [Bordetella petrii]